MAYATIRRGASEGIWSIDSEEGSSFFIPKQLAARLGYYENQKIDKTQYCQLKDVYVAMQVREKALSLLARREHSHRELTLKLLRRGFEKTIIETELNRLEKQGVLDDARYAATFVASRQARNPEGKPMLQARLAQKGIDREIINDVLHEWFDDNEQVGTALLTAIRKLSKSSSSTDQLVYKLRKKGFSASQIRMALEKENAALD